MPFIPDEEQSISPRFIPEERYNPKEDQEARRLIEQGKSAQRFLDMPFLSKLAGSLNLGSYNIQEAIGGFMTPEEEKRIHREALGQGIAGSVPRFVASTGEALVDIPAMALGKDKLTREYKLPFLPAFKSYQSEAKEALNKGVQPFGWQSFGAPSVQAGLGALETLGMGKLLFTDVYLTSAKELAIKTPEWVSKGGKIIIRAGGKKGKVVPGLIDLSVKVGQAKLGNWVQKDLQKNWEEVFTHTKAGMKKYTKSRLQGKDAAKFLADKRIPIEQSMGKIDTTRTVAKLDEDVSPWNGVFNEILKRQGKRINTDELEQMAINAVNNKLTRGQNIADDMTRTVMNEFAGIRRQYGDWIPLDQLNDIKIGQRIQSGIFDMTKPKFVSDVNYQISNVTRKMIEDSIDDISAKEINKQIGNYYDAMDMLKNIHGQVLKGGRLGRLVGMAIGSTFGKTPLGKITGIATGNYVVGIMQDATITNDVKLMLLKYAKNRDPQIWQEAMQYVQNQYLQQLTRQQLGEGAIPLMPKTQTSGRMDYAPEDFPMPAQNTGKYLLEAPKAIPMPPKKSGIDVFRGMGSTWQTIRNPKLNNWFGEATYVARDEEMAKMFGTVTKGTLKLAEKDILKLNRPEEYDKIISDFFTKYAKKINDPDLFYKYFPEYIKKLGYKAIEATFDKMGGIAVFDKTLIKFLK